MQLDERSKVHTHHNQQKKTQTFQVSRILRESHALEWLVTRSRIAFKISRFSRMREMREKRIRNVTNLTKCADKM